MVAALVAILGSAFGCYVGIKVSLAEIRGSLALINNDVKRIEDKLDYVTNNYELARKDHEERIRWLEERCYAQGELPHRK